MTEKWNLHESFMQAWRCMDLNVNTLSPHHSYSQLESKLEEWQNHDRYTCHRVTIFSMGSQETRKQKSKQIHFVHFAFEMIIIFTQLSFPFLFLAFFRSQNDSWGTTLSPWWSSGKGLYVCVLVMDLRCTCQQLRGASAPLSFWQNIDGGTPPLLPLEEMRKEYIHV